MDRSEIEVVLNRDRAWLLDTYAAMPADELVRGITASEYDPSSMWSAQDHLAHLAGIEKNFNGMIRRHFAGDPNPVGLTTDADGQPRTRDQIMAVVHEMTEAWVREYRGKSLSEVVALGQAVRAETLVLLSELTDAQLEEKLDFLYDKLGVFDSRSLVARHVANPQRITKPQPAALKAVAAVMSS